MRQKRSQPAPTPMPRSRLPEVPRVPLAERVALGRAQRQATPRGAHAAWDPPPARDLLGLIEASNQGRTPQLVPLRHSRMLASPFAFYRGAPAVMAYDLAQTPTSGVYAQLCGDCHISNFGMFSSPERTLVFDLNDFDETLPGPFEWDLKRTAASIAVAARYADQNETDYAAFQQAVADGRLEASAAISTSQKR
jgi:uncharacterized protein (DUF2252 family)